MVDRQIGLGYKDEVNKVFGRVKKLFGRLGPGFITGAADDDPSGVATYSIAGAQYGYHLNWLSLFLLPAMFSIQEMCGRIGLVSGRGLASAIKKFYSVKVLILATILLTIANTINIAADLGIIAASTQMITGIPFYLNLFLAAGMIIWMQIAVSYKKYSSYLKWMSLSLLVYVLTAFLVKQNWKAVLTATLIPHIEFNSDYLMTMIGFLGTTISPYLFFWQASEEVEERIVKGKIADFNNKVKVKLREIKRMRQDTQAGMLFSNVITFFIILTTTATLFNNGINHIETPQEAAMALRPLAGNMAYFLFAFGIIGIGWQSIPVLAGSVGYALSEVFGFDEGLSKKFKEARAFYLIIAFSTIVGILLNLLHVNIIRALYYSAVVNGVASVPLIAIIIKMASDKRVVGRFVSTKSSNLIAWTTFVFILLAVVIMIYQLV